MTNQDLISIHNLPAATAKKRWQRAQKNGRIVRAWGLSVSPNSDEIKVLLGDKITGTDTGTSGDNAKNVPDKKAGTTRGQARTKIDFQMLLFWGLCGAITVGHAGLVWFDCAYLWGMAGKIAGGIVFLVILAALVLMSGKRLKEVSEQMLWFVWLVEAAAWFVHWPSFKGDAAIGYSKGVTDITTQFLAAFICICAMAATYFYRQTMIER